MQVEILLFFILKIVKNVLKKQRNVKEIEKFLLY